MNIKPIKTDSDYRMALKRLEEIFDAPIGTPESDKADILGIIVDDYEKKQMQTKSPRVELYKWERWIIGLAIFFASIGFIAYVISILVFSHKITSLSDKIPSFGNLGSFISGTIGALWSLVGVILFYITLRLQRRDLTLQKDELELTRRELEGQKLQMIEQNQTLTKQRFEDTFFKLLNLQNDIVNSIAIKDERETRHGRRCFPIMYYYFKNQAISKLSIHNQNHLEQIRDFTLEITIRGYYDFFGTYQSELAHYFTNLYRIIKFVDESAINQKEEYVKFQGSTILPRINPNLL